MIPTPIGAVLLLISALLFFRPVRDNVAFFLACSLLPGASALDAPALGHSSIPPAMIALASLLLRQLRRDVRETKAWRLGLTRNAWLLVYCVYAAATSLVLPRIFAGRINVVTLAHASAGFIPLAFTSQNITQALYILATAATAVAVTSASTRARFSEMIVSAVLWTSLAHVVSGYVDLLASGLHVQGLFDVVRNGAYAQLDQNEGGFHRISGMTPEPSSYAGLAATFLVFTTELWLRGIRPRFAGTVSLLLISVLILSTSSTAYLSLVSLAVLIVLRLTLFPGSISTRKVASICMLAALGGTGVILIALLDPRYANQALTILGEMTFAKSSSSSGIERGIWARQGWDAFLASRGLGIGIGSFRASGIFTAILGAIGPAGLLLLGGYLLIILRPGRRNTFWTSGRHETNIGVVCSWAAIFVMIPASLLAVSADPGTLFAFFAGASAGLRGQPALASDGSDAPRRSERIGNAALAAC